jgi:hypothetical protein
VNVVIILGLVLLGVLLVSQTGTSGGFFGNAAGAGKNYIDPASIGVYATNAGFAGSDAAVAVAIAMAESSGNASAYNPETAAGAPAGKGSFGLWQIYLNAHPEFAGQNLFDPAVNANAAYSVYAVAGMSFTPWSTYNSGAYNAYMPVTQGVIVS